MDNKNSKNNKSKLNFDAEQDVQERISDLDYDEKKEMFHEFKKAGGQVVDLDSLQEDKEIPTLTFKEYRQSQREQMLDDLEDEKKDFFKTRKPSLLKGFSKEYKNWFMFIKIRWMMFVRQISFPFSPLFYYKMAQKLFREYLFLAEGVSEDFSNFFMFGTEKEVKYFQKPLLKNEETAKDYEILLWLNELVPEELSKKTKTLSLRNHILHYERTVGALFYPLYTLYKQKESIEDVIINAFDVVEKNHISLQIDSSNRNYEQQIFLHNLSNLMNTYYELFLYIMQYYYYKSDKFKQMDFSEFVEQFSSEKFLGKTPLRIQELEPLALALEKEEQKNQIADTEKESEEQTHKDLLKRVVQIFKKNIDFEHYIEDFNEQLGLKVFSVEDKLLLTYILVDFFDRQFSFFTQNKYVSYTNYVFMGNTIDTKQDLGILFDQFEKIYNGINTYAKVSVQLLKMGGEDKNNVEAVNQYKNYQKQVSNQLRQEMLHIFENLQNKINGVVASLGVSQDAALVQNADDVLYFPSNFMDNRLANGENVQDSFIMARDLATAIYDLLYYYDLSGRNILIEQFDYLSFLENGE